MTKTEFIAWTLDRQLDTQRERASMLIDLGRAKWLQLVRVEYKHSIPRVSIIGHAISEGAVDVWRGQGAAVQEIERITVATIDATFANILQGK